MKNNIYRFWGLSRLSSSDCHRKGKAYVYDSDTGKSFCAPSNYKGKGGQMVLPPPRRKPKPSKPIACGCSDSCFPTDGDPPSDPMVDLIEKMFTIGKGVIKENSNFTSPGGGGDSISQHVKKCFADGASGSLIDFIECVCDTSTSPTCYQDTLQRLQCGCSLRGACKK